MGSQLKQKIITLLKILIAPLFLFGFYLLVLLLWKAFRLPTDERLIELTRQWFMTFGIFVVFISAIIEGTLILGQYYPGGLVIFLGVISAAKIFLRLLRWWR